MTHSTSIIQTDILICGSGSAGLTAALWLAKYGIAFRILERRDGPLVTGQADGVQCRTVEIFESFGLSDQLLRESYHVLELAFWAPDHDTELSDGEKGGIKWSHYAPDTEPGLSHQPHVILNQARINEMITKEMLRCGGAEIDYGYDVKSVHVDSNTARDPGSYPVTVTALKNGVEQVFRAKYALGCDGAHSAVRKALGFKMLGDSTDAIWGVMDLYPRTTFPDIRKKAVIQSSSGNLMIIPREGDSLVRFYIELPPDTVASKVSLEDLQQRAKLIFRPYEMDIAETTWWSAYQIGQRLADNFHEQYRVFLTGDACHTHSPKAGQGMNVSLQDGYNIGWKLGSYLSGQATEDLVKTYVSERQQTAAELIEFDRMWSKIFKSGTAANGAGPDYVRDQFAKAGRYTAGQAYKYGKSIITWPSGEIQKADGTVKYQHSRECKLVVGMRLPSAQVVRYSDGKVHQLLSLFHSDCRWRVAVFAGDIRQQETRDRLDRVASTLESSVQGLTSDGQDEDSAIESLLVLKTKRTAIRLDHIPRVFKPITGKHGIQSLHKVFVDDDSYNSGHGHAFDTIGINHEGITIVVVRPDQYISTIIKEQGADSLQRFFNGFLVTRT
ncbi:FAD binding domain-containing protein [Diaporthe helianthi]|uniref:FAD binding domain-containing protein n=1 Tax=Diaporthe helianthi TaxID=158607 RepID=A0A2P5HRC9_DIAHE|nr:FAD binding domain-containing protein [Diaporthe helianthi]